MRQPTTDVSIHAPVKGATGPHAGQQLIARVSIHAPVKGATVKALIAKHKSASFNPRAREGRDVAGRARHTRNHRFNPRAREGRDRTPRRAAECGGRFQSTRP